MTMPANYYQRFDASKEYEEHLFVAGRGLQSAELNELQKNSNYRMRSIADVLFKDGALIRDAGIVVDPDTGVTQCQSGAVYVFGAVRGLAPASFTIPVYGTFAIGVRLIETVVTAITDPLLRDPAPLTRNFDEEGAERLKIHSQWGWSGDGGTGDFFPVYEVINGFVSAKEPPPELDSMTQAVARYDRDSAGGSYIVSGLTVKPMDDSGGSQVYNLSEGRARIFGYPVELQTSRRLIYAATPDLRPIANEPHLSSTAGAQRINFDCVPATSITSVSITNEKTVTNLLHGIGGSQDALPDTSILSIVEVKQGGTTYVLTTDYLLTAGKVDWSPAGAEPTPGSTYDVKYHYITNVTPTSVDTAGCTVTGAVVNTLVLVDYSQMLPRIDRLCMDAGGYTLWVKGIAAAYNQQPPVVPADALIIASIHQTWTASRSVVHDSVRVVSMPALAKIDSRFDYILQLIAAQRLEGSIHTREGGTKKGLFVDPFLDDSQRDAGTAQTAAIIDGELMLPIAVTVHQMGTDIVAPVTNSFTLVSVLSQTLKTSSAKINPYEVFRTKPGHCRIHPHVHRWTHLDTTWNSGHTRRILKGSMDGITNDNSSTNGMLSSSIVYDETLSQINITYRLDHFEPLESLASITFDGIDIPTGGAVADGAGVIDGSFMIPAAIPAGVKEVRFLGGNLTEASAVYDGHGSTNRDHRYPRDYPIYPPVRDAVSPIAQTFTLTETIQIHAIDLWFTVAPTSNLIVQIRETSNGIPSATVIDYAVVSPSNVSIGGASTRVTFDSAASLFGGTEYAIVLQCSDSTGAVSIAELGKFDVGAGVWITNQPYSVGLLLTSTNATSWTQHRDRDLTFRILKRSYDIITAPQPLGVVTVAGATDLLVLSNSRAASSATKIEYSLLLPSGAGLLIVDAGQPVQLATAITGDIEVGARLSGDAKFSPVLDPGVQLVEGILASTGDYVSRAVPAGTSVTIKVIYEAIVPSGSSVSALYKGQDIGGTWTSIGATTSAMTDGFFEFVHTATGVTEITAQIKLILSGTPVARPRVRDLRVIIL